MKTNFLYHAEAVGCTGQITLPVQETIDIQAPVALALTGGQATARVENFNHRNYLKIKSIESHVVGSFSAKDNAHGTLCSVVIDGLSIMDVVTVDRIVMRLTSKHSKDEEPSYHLHGTRFENLCIAGHPISVKMYAGLLSQLSTWKKINDGYQNDPNIKKQLDEISMYSDTSGTLPAPNGYFGCYLGMIPDPLPDGWTRKDGGVYIPHFGTIWLGEFYVAKHTRRIMMFHVDLGCSTEGCYSGGGGGSNGNPYP